MPVELNTMDLDQNKIFLILSQPGKMRERNMEIIRIISGLGFHTLVVTTNFPYSVLKKLYEQNGIALSKVTFIDAVTRNSIGSVENIPGEVRYVNSPANLTDMGIAVTSALKDLSGKKVCILYDSISTMLIYLSSQNISKFIHFVTTKLRLLDLSGIFLAAEKGIDPQLQSQLATFVDTVIDIPD
ncbi:MAG: hypothetical protein ABFC24_04340 [Methanoregulaceae archaeon]